MGKWLLLILLQTFTWASWGQNLLDVAEKEYFQPELFQVIGNEVEMANLTVNEVGRVLQAILGGEIVKSEHTEAVIDPVTHRKETFRLVEKENRNSVIGIVKIKREENGTSNDNLRGAYATTVIVEIVGKPLTYQQSEHLQQALYALKANGALGTDAGFAISIQTNVEMADGHPEKMSPEHLIDIWRVYFKRPHREQIARKYNIPAHRQKYLGYYSKGMMDRIFDDNYKKGLTWERLFFDFMYRQSLEVIGYKDAWTMGENQAREFLKQELTRKGFEIILPVIKWNYIRASSLFMFLFPNDWLTQFLEKTTWFHKHPILEFREPNNDFEMQEKNRQVLGLIQEVRRRGDFTHIDEQWERENNYPSRSCKNIFLLPY